MSKIFPLTLLQRGRKPRPEYAPWVPPGKGYKSKRLLECPKLAFGDLKGAQAPASVQKADGHGLHHARDIELVAWSQREPVSCPRSKEICQRKQPPSGAHQPGRKRSPVERKAGSGMRGPPSSASLPGTIYQGGGAVRADTIRNNTT